MAHIYVGFHDQRSCNRILKPPGGGTSNIFGTDAIPDVVPQNSPRKETKQSGTMQHILQTNTVTSETRNEETSSTTNGGVTVEHKVCKVQNNQNGGEINEDSNLQEIALVQQEVVGQNDVHSSPEVSVEITSKVEQLRIEERSSNSEVSETDSSGNTKIISSNASSEGSVEKNSSFKQGSSIEDILKQDDIEEKKKVKGLVQRVPPGGYSSGLW